MADTTQGMADTRDKELAQDARERLIAAASRVFADHGYGSARVQHITDIAGVNKAMLYYYFNSKEEIYEFLMAKGAQIISNAVSEGERCKGTFREKMSILLLHYIKAAEENPDIARMILQEVTGGGAETRQKVVVFYKEQIHRLTRLIAEGQASGELRKGIDPMYPALSLFGIANMFITRFLVIKMDIVPHQEMDGGSLHEKILDMFLDGIAEKG